MTQQLATTNAQQLARIATATGYESSKVALIKDTIARGASDDELMLFLHLAQRSGLDPFSRQIYLIERQSNVNGQWITTRQPQTGIDGLRLIADRTDRYAPGHEPSFTYDADGRLETATSYVKKWVRGEWHEVAATAHYREYVQTKKDGNPTKMWTEKPHIMLAKCAEALALRRAFPAEMSGLYTSDEIPAGDTLTALPPAPRADVVTGEVIDDAPAPTSVKKKAPTRGDLLTRIQNLTLGADALELEVVLLKPLDQMTDDELIAHGKNLRAAIDAAQAEQAKQPAEAAA
jgi:phage recombination protein Bet